MKRARALLVGTTLLLPCSAFAQAPAKSLFLHNDFTASHCWSASSSANSATVTVTPQTPPAPHTTAAPKPSVVISNLWGASDGKGMRDPQVAAGGNYLVAITATGFRFFEAKNGTYQPIVNNGCLPLSGSVTSLFAPLLQPKDANGTPNAADVNRSDSLKHSAGHCAPDATSGNATCVTFIEDIRARYINDRFWIVGAASNGVQSSDTNGSEAARFFVVAISKTSDPKDGFWEYALYQQYEDWPTFSVRTPWLISGHKNETDLWRFDATDLPNGATHDPYKEHFDLKGSHKITMVTPVWMTGTGPLLIYGREQGTTHGALVAIDDQGHRTTTDVTLPVEMRWSMLPTYRAGALWFARDFHETTPDEMDVLRLPIDFNNNTATVPSGTRLYRLRHTGQSFGLPGIEVDEDGAAIIFYLAFSATAPCEMRYNVLLPGDDNFRDAVTWHKGPLPIASIDGIDNLDLPGGQANGHGIWFSTMDAAVAVSGSTRPHALDQAIAKVEPGCGDHLMCNDRCTDQNSDDKNCGACGHKCGGGDPSCVNGRCTCSTHLDSDEKNCGTCGHKCGGSEPTCEKGRCTCTARVESDEKNCGACGHKCGASEPTCEKGHCTCTAATQTDKNNCGACGHKCTTPECKFGVCCHPCPCKVPLCVPDPNACHRACRAQGPAAR